MHGASAGFPATIGPECNNLSESFDTTLAVLNPKPWVQILNVKP